MPHRICAVLNPATRPRGKTVMDVNRRHLIGASAAGVAGALAMSPDAARAAPLTSAIGRDATQYGVRPGSADDQTKNLQRAIDEAARAQVPLALPPGIYRTGLLRLQNGTQLIGVRGATKLVFNGGASMLLAEGAGPIRLRGLTLDGGSIPLPSGAASCTASAGTTSASAIARSLAAAATASGSSRSPATSAAIFSRTSRQRRWCRSMRSG